MDLVKPEEIPDGCSFIEANVLELVGWNSYVGLKYQSAKWDCRPDFICASSPCQEFSTMRNFRPPVTYPEQGIALFNHARALCEKSGIPYVMENVAGAQKYVGRAETHCGSYFLWGNGIPPILPQGMSKGMTELAMGLREHKGKPGWDDRHGFKGQTPSALVATIPPELANCVAEYAERICEASVK